MLNIVVVQLPREHVEPVRVISTAAPEVRPKSRSSAMREWSNERAIVSVLCVEKYGTSSEKKKLRIESSLEPELSYISCTSRSLHLISPSVMPLHEKRRPLDTKITRSLHRCWRRGCRPFPRVYTYYLFHCPDWEAWCDVQRLKRMSMPWLERVCFLHHASQDGSSAASE